MHQNADGDGPLTQFMLCSLYTCVGSRGRDRMFDGQMHQVCIQMHISFCIDSSRLEGFENCVGGLVHRVESRGLKITYEGCQFSKTSRKQLTS